MSNSFSVIAHRGESYDAPENTMSSVRLAWERNADSVEIDIHLTMDNSIVVFHDSLKARDNLYHALPTMLEKFSKDFRFLPIPESA